MQFVMDLHLHSKYSRAVSQDMVLPTMSRLARLKGLDILTASDWTHPLWQKEIRSLLTERGEGIYGLQSDTEDMKPVYFFLTTEISSIYKHNGKLRRIHNLVFVPDFETAEKVTKALLKKGCNLLADGRPIVGLSSHDLFELVLSVNDQAMLIPCHVWTPHFGVYGSASGYDSLQESFEDLAPFIYAIETGLSSDPEMNWLIKELKTRSILSFSDAHSPLKMGREATVFELEKPSYSYVRKAIMAQGAENKGEKKNRIVYTIEFYPEEGKYHFSGHRNCKVVFGPQEIQTFGSVCPSCKRQLTEGVLFRLQQLSDRSLAGKVNTKYNPQQLRWYTDGTKTHPPYVKLVPLLEIVAQALSSTVASQKVKTMFEALCTSLGSELEILLKASPGDIAKVANDRVAEGVELVRKGDIVIDPGYDGEYGKVTIWHTQENQVSKVQAAPQLSLEL